MGRAEDTAATARAEGGEIRAEGFGLHPQVSGELPLGFRWRKDVLDVHFDHRLAATWKINSRGQEAMKSVQKVSKKCRQMATEA